MSLQSSKYDGGYDFAALQAALVLTTVYHPTGAPGLGAVTTTAGQSKTGPGRPLLLRSVFNLSGAGTGTLRLFQGDGTTQYFGFDWTRSTNVNGQGAVLNIYLANGLSLAMFGATDNWIVSFSLL